MTTTEQDLSIYEHVRQSEIDAERARLIRDAREFPLPAVPSGYAGPPRTANPWAGPEVLEGMEAARRAELARPRTPAQIDAWVDAFGRRTSAQRQAAIDEEAQRRLVAEEAERAARTCPCCEQTRPYPPQTYVLDGVRVRMCTRCFAVATSLLAEGSDRARVHTFLVEAGALQSSTDDTATQTTEAYR